MNHSKSKVEVHPVKGLKMEIVTDRWLRICIGLSILMLSATPLAYVLMR